MIGAAKAIISNSVASVYSMFVSPSGIFTTSPPGSATSAFCEAYPSNGDEPYTYSWTKISGDSISISDPSAKKVSFSASGTGDRLTAIYECEVTDNSLNTLTDQVEVVFLFSGGF